jgi:hypothetical protein
MGSPINDPHPNDALAVEEPGAVQEPEDFFGENGDGEEAHDELVPREPGDNSPIVEGELPADAPAQVGERVSPDELVPIGPEDLADAAASAADDEAVQYADQPADTTEAVQYAAEDESAADDEPAAESEIEEEETGNKRAYVVLQEIVLDQDALNELLKAVKGGVPPMKALIEVHRVSVTNPKSALNAAWKRHKDEWVEPPRLAVVTASKIRARKAKPKVREITGYTFED